MNWTISLLGDGFWTRLKDFFTGIFAVIPQFIYFFYTCIASVLDVLQYLIRKLAGLDVYYVDGVQVEGDILSELINGVLGLNGRYSALNTVFWSMMIFGVIVLILSVIISIIKAHYNYNEKTSHPSVIIGKALKNLATMAIVPIVTVFGIYLSNIFLKALDSFTATSSMGTTAEVYATSEGNYQTVFESRKDNFGQSTYVSYDFFGSDAPTGTVTISGILFRAAANDCNRVRYGGYTASNGGASMALDDGGWSNCGIFSSTLSSPSEQKEAVAYMIDYAFANNLRLTEKQTASILKSESLTLISSFKFLQSRVWYAGTINFQSFSKYNVGLVWYYYNLWQFNFLVGYIGIAIALVLLSNIVFGMMVRLLECTALMICLGPIVGIGPLDGGGAFKQWTGKFMSDVLTAYGAIAGLNLSFMLLPYMENLAFFNSTMLNSIVEMMFIIVLLIAVKQVISLIAGLVGGGDAVSLGSSLKGEVASAAKKGGDGTAKAASLAVKIGKLIPATKAVVMAAEKAAKKIAEAKKKLGEKIKNSKAGKWVAEKKHELGEKVKNSKLGSWARQKFDGMISEEEHEKLLDKEEAELKAEKEDNEKKIKENEEKINKVDGAKDRGANENRAEADRLEQEANDLEKEMTDFRADFDAFLSSKTKDFNTYLNNNGKAKVDKKLSGQINAQKNLFKAGKVNKNKAYDNVAADIDKEKGFFAKGHQITENRAVASSIRAVADLQDENRSLQDRNTEIDKRMELIRSEGFVIEGKERIVRRLTPKGLGKQIVQFSGETFKAVGGTLGFDEMIKKLNKETSIIDSGKIILKDFAQSLGANISDAKALMTNKEKDDFKRAEKQSKQVVNDGVQETKSLTKAIDDLCKEIKKTHDS